MNLDGIVECLRIPRASAYKLAQKGKIPWQNVGRHWRFRREAVEQPQTSKTKGRQLAIQEARSNACGRG